MSNHPPESIRVGPFDFSIVMIDGDLADRLGEDGDLHGYTIHLSRAQKGARMADTALREVMHAIFRVYGLKDADDEERTVGVLSTGLVQVMRDNPEFTKWLKRQTNP